MQSREWVKFLEWHRWVFLAHSHQCLGTKPSSLFHQLASLCQKVWERLFITTSWFPASLPYPSFLSCGLARSKGAAGHTASLPSMWLPLSPISKFTPFSPFFSPSRFAGYLPVNMSCTTCLSLSHRNLCIFICIFLYHTWKALTLKQIFFQIFGTQVSVNQMHTIEDYFLPCYCLQARCPTLLHTGWENPGLQHQFPLENHLSHFQSLSELLILHKCTVSGFENTSWCIHNCLTHARSKYKFPLLTFEAHRPHSGRCVRLVLTCRVTH